LRARPLAGRSRRALDPAPRCETVQARETFSRNAAGRARSPAVFSTWRARGTPSGLPARSDLWHLLVDISRRAARCTGLGAWLGCVSRLAAPRAFSDTERACLVSSRLGAASIRAMSPCRRGCIGLDRIGPIAAQVRAGSLAAATTLGRAPTSSRFVRGFAADRVLRVAVGLTRGHGMRKSKRHRDVAGAGGVAISMNEYDAGPHVANSCSIALAHRCRNALRAQLKLGARLSRPRLLARLP
jgi:hypothetical protein